MYGDHRDLHVLSHSFPTRRSSALLIDTGLKDAVLVDQAEGQIAGEDLRHRVERAVRARHFMEPLVRKVGNADVVAQAAIAGVLTAAILADDAQASQAAQDIATRLDEIGRAHV